jgi:acyl transferase domain-containing protein
MELGNDEAFRDYCIANNVRRDTLSIRHLLVADNQTQALDRLTSLISKIDHQKFERPSSGEIAFGLLGSPFFTSDLKESFKDFGKVKDEWDIKLQKSNVDPALAEKFSFGLALLQLWKRFGIETDYFAVDEWQKSTALMLLDMSSEKTWIQSNDQYVPSRRVELNEWDENIVEVDSDSGNQDQAVDRLVDLGVKTLIMLGRDDSLESPLRETPTLELTATDNFWGYVASGLKLAYEGGQNINWRVVHGSVSGRISLPHYPFEKTRFWLETGTEAKITPAKDPSERHSLASGSNPIEAVFREQWLELTRQTNDLAARQFLQYQQMLGSNDHAGNIDSVEIPELICQGNWRLIVLNGTDSRQILASAQAFPVSLPDEFEANFQSVKAQGGTDGLIGAAVVWEAESHESVSLDTLTRSQRLECLGRNLVDRLR